MGHLFCGECLRRLARFASLLRAFGLGQARGAVHHRVICCPAVLRHVAAGFGELVVIEVFLKSHTVRISLIPRGVPWALQEHIRYLLDRLEQTSGWLVVIFAWKQHAVLIREHMILVIPPSVARVDTPNKCRCTVMKS
jgi:hypothetical protein